MLVVVVRAGRLIVIPIDDVVWSPAVGNVEPLFRHVGGERVKGILSVAELQTWVAEFLVPFRDWCRPLAACHAIVHMA